MKSYIFKIEMESDEEGWRAYYPPLEDVGASTWGSTREEALKNIQEVLSMIVEEFEAEGKSISTNEEVTVSENILVSVNA